MYSIRTKQNFIIMAKSNIIQTGKFKGLAEITAERIERQSKLAKTVVSAAEFPTKKEPIIKLTARTGQNCKGGTELYFDAIDSCQHFSTCGLCVDPSRASTSITLKKRVVGLEEVFDTAAYMATVSKKQQVAMCAK